MVYLPLPLVLVVYFCCGPVAVIMTSGTTAPCWSVTCPMINPRNSWAWTRLKEKRTTISPHKGLIGGWTRWVISNLPYFELRCSENLNAVFQIQTRPAWSMLGRMPALEHHQ